MFQDEVLCHRFGLLPIKANPDDFNFPLMAGASSAFMTDEDKEAANDNFTEEPVGDPDVNLVFEIKVRPYCAVSVSQSDSLLAIPGQV